MKKLLIFVVVAMMFLAAGCRERIIEIDVPAVDSLMNNLTIVAEPDDTSITFTVQGLPDSLPSGFEGVSIFLSTTDIRETSGPEIDTSTRIFSGITADGDFEHIGLDNGVAYYFAGRADVAGDTVSTVGFGGMFYPRPWGSGSYLGFDPGETPPEDGVNNAIFFNRINGDGEIRSYSDTDVDFYFSLEGTDFNMAPKDPAGGVAASGLGVDKWLDEATQTAPGSYEQSVMLELEKIYYFKTADDYYGKIMVDSVTLHVDTLSIWVTYAFQTAAGVQNY